MALVACDDIHLTQLYRPPVTAIRRDLNLLGKTAAHLLLQGIQNKWKQDQSRRQITDAARDPRVIELSLRCVIRK